MKTELTRSFDATRDLLEHVGPGMERRRLACLLDKLARVSDMRIDYRAAWLSELRAGRDGQRLDQGSSWKLNGLWRAACRQIRIEGLERQFGFMVNVGARAEHLAGLLDNLEREWQDAHAAFLEDGTRVAA